jgi:hypothetical protein
MADYNQKKYVADLMNAPGPFYVVAGECIACCLPEAEAPDLMGFRYDGPGQYDSGCFFKKQPERPEELDRALLAMSVNCVDTLRYAGRDPEILHRLRELGMEGQCDYPLAGNSRA